MIWYLLLILIFLFILWLLLVPVVIIIQTDANRYSLSMPGVFRAEAVTGDDFFLIKGWILFVPYRFNPLKKRKKKSRKKKDTEEKKKKFRLPSGGLSMAREALHTVRIKKFELDIDTDDFLLNAWLFPVFSMVQSSSRQMRINFEGYNALHLDIRVRLGVLLWAVIRNRITNFF